MRFTATGLGLWIIVAIRWNYFDVNALAVERRLVSLLAATTPLAEQVYSYFHLPMVGGAILFSLAVKKSLAHAYEPLGQFPTITLFGGLANFLLAQVAFTIRCGGPISVPRLVVAILLILTIPISDQFQALTLLVTASGLFTILVAVELFIDRGLRSTILISTHHTWVKE